MTMTELDRNRSGLPKTEALGQLIGIDELDKAKITSLASKNDQER